MFRSSLITFEHRPNRIRPADKMRVQMRDFLAAHTPRVDDHAESIRTAAFLRQTPGNGKQAAQRRLVSGLRLGQ